MALAAMRVSRHVLLRWPAYAYIFYFRGTPLLVQLFLVYYGSGQFRTELEGVVIWRYLNAAGDQVQITLWHYFRDAWFCAVLTLMLNTSAYTAEILRGALQSVARGQIEAARANRIRLIPAARAASIWPRATDCNAPRRISAV